MKGYIAKRAIALKRNRKTGPPSFYELENRAASLKHQQIKLVIFYSPISGYN